MEDVREWFPEGTQLTVLSVDEDGRIYVRWPGEPGYVNDAVLRVTTSAARERALKDDARD